MLSAPTRQSLSCLVYNPLNLRLFGLTLYELPILPLLWDSYGARASKLPARNTNVHPRVGRVRSLGDAILPSYFSDPAATWIVSVASLCRMSGVGN